MCRKILDHDVRGTCHGEARIRWRPWAGRHADVSRTDGHVSGTAEPGPGDGDRVATDQDSRRWHDAGHNRRWFIRVLIGRGSCADTPRGLDGDVNGADGMRRHHRYSD